MHCLGWFHKKTTGIAINHCRGIAGNLIVTLLENLGGTCEGMPWLCPNGSEPAARALPFSYFLFLLRVYHVRDLVKPHFTCQNANTFNR